MGKVKKLTDEQRNNIEKLLNRGLKPAEIAEIIGVSDTAVRSIDKILRFIKEEKWDELREFVKKNNGSAPLAWALKKYNVLIPEAKPKIDFSKIQVEPPIFQFEEQLTIDGIKTAVSEAIAESCKCNIEQIDKDQMARIMLALGRIAGSLETIIDKLDDLAEAWK